MKYTLPFPIVRQNPAHKREFARIVSNATAILTKLMFFVILYIDYPKGVLPCPPLLVSAFDF